MLQTLRNLGPMEISLAIVVLGGIVTAILTGYLKARKIQPRGFKLKHFGFEAIVAVISGVLSGFVLKGLGWALAFIKPVVLNPAPAAWWQIALEYAAFFFLFDAWFYWLHRWMHNEPWYKLIHKLHHKSTSPNLLTTFSVNPLESLVNGGFMQIFATASMVILMPIHKETMPLIAATTVLMGLYVHSGYEFMPKWWNKTWLTKWFITATFHDHHHKYFNYNYGGFTQIWDRICGTMHKKYEADYVKIKERPIRAPKPEEVPAE